MKPPIPIATNWKVLRLDKVAFLERKSIQASTIPDGTHYVGLEHIQSDHGTVEMVSVQNGELASSKFAFNENHILYGKLRPYLSKIARPQGTGICSTDIIPILPGPQLDKSYLYHYLRQPLCVDYATSRSSGANLPRLSPKELAAFPIPLPPLPEQKRIAAILDKADAIRRKRKAALDMADEFIQSCYLHLCGPGHSDYKSWSEVEIQELAEPKKNSMRTGPFGSSLKHSEFVDKGIAVLGIDNAVTNRFQWKELRYIMEDKYKDLKRYTVYPNDVIVTIMGTTGRSAVVPKDVPTAISTKHLATITVDRQKAHPEYLSNAFHRDPYLLQQVRGANRGAIMSGLNLGIIKETKLHLPPLELQQQFANLLEKTRACIDRNGYEQSDSLFASLSQRAFRGEL
jgi:type I restriction enzyme S subunit